MNLEADSIPLRRRAVYAVLVLFLLAAILEACLRVSGLGVLFKPFECAGEGPETQAECKFLYNPGVKFKTPKPAGKKRIVVVGESAVNGWPFSRAAFPEMMAAALEAEPRTRGKFEVINLSTNGVNAGFLREVLREGLPLLQPDIVIIYAGNNELLGYEFFDRLRTPKLNRALWWLRRHYMTWNLPLIVTTRLLSRGLAVGMMLEISRMEGKYDRALFPEKTKRHALQAYQARLQDMAELCREAGALPFLATPGSNLAGWIPMKSVHGKSLDQDTKDQVENAVRRGRELLRAGKPEQALPLLRKAAATDPAYAKAWFFLGRAELELEKPDSAMSHLAKAAELSDFFQQVPPSWNQETRRLASRLGVPLIDVEKALQKKASRGIPGFDLFVDGCHPTLSGHRAIAEAMLSGLSERGLLPAWPREKPLPSLDALLELTHANKKALALAYFNQAAVLAFLYRHPEYYSPALQYLEEAMRLSPNPGLVRPYQGYLALLQNKPEKAAAFFSRGYAKAPEVFRSVINAKFKGFLIFQGDVLCAKKAEPSELHLLYPSAKKTAKSSKPERCDYRFSWTGRGFKPAR